jgi:hypothetical protein
MTRQKSVLFLLLVAIAMPILMGNSSCGGDFNERVESDKQWIRDRSDDVDQAIEDAASSIDCLSQGDGGLFNRGVQCGTPLKIGE